MPKFVERIHAVLTRHLPALWNRRTSPVVFGVAAGLILVAVLAVFLLRPAPPPPRVSLYLVHPPWDCAHTTALLFQAVFEMRLEQDVRLAEVSPAEMWRRVAMDEADCAVAAWLPETHKTLFERYKDEVEDLGPLLEGARVGVVVLAGSPARSLADLPGLEGRHGGVIMGLDPGSEQMRLTREAMDVYGLGGYVLREGTIRTIKEYLDAAEADERDVVVALWSPHWLFGRHDLRWLADPHRVFGEPESIHVIAHPSLRQKAPEAHAALKAFRLTPEALGQAMEIIRTAHHPELAARQWVRDHAALVDSWIEHGE